GGRHRDSPRQPAGSRGAAEPHGPVARFVRLPVLHHVSRLSEPPALDARRIGRGRGPQPHHRAREPEALDEGRARPDALDSINCRFARTRPFGLLGAAASRVEGRQGDTLMAYTLPPLPYASDALEPHIDKQTMEIHHGKHHQAYINNLNAALEKHPDLQSKS